MNKYFIILLAFVLISCKKSNFLNNDLYEITRNYQTKFPIPKTTLNNKFLYILQFEKLKNDTLIILSRSSSGLIPNTAGYGIYKESNIANTFVIDKENLSSSLINPIKCKKDIECFYWDYNDISEESFPPLYKYKLKNNKFNLVKIDTVWLNWR